MWGRSAVRAPTATIEGRVRSDIAAGRRRETRMMRFTQLGYDTRDHHAGSKHSDGDDEWVNSMPVDQTRAGRLMRRDIRWITVQSGLVAGMRDAERPRPIGLPGCCTGQTLVTRPGGEHGSRTVAGRRARASDRPASGRDPPQPRSRIRTWIASRPWISEKRANSGDDIAACEERRLRDTVRKENEGGQDGRGSSCHNGRRWGGSTRPGKTAVAKAE